MQEATDADAELDGPGGSLPARDSTTAPNRQRSNGSRGSKTAGGPGGIDETTDTEPPSASDPATATSIPIPTESPTDSTTSQTTSSPPPSTTTEPTAPPTSETLTSPTTSVTTKPGAHKVLQPAEPTMAAPAGAPPATTAGKLFYVNDRGEKKTCSGSSLNTEHKNIVITAAHCVRAFRGEKYFTDFIFVPGYDHGKTPYGKWAASGVLTFDRWVHGHDYRYDQGFIRIEPLEGHQLGEVVGGNGVIVNSSASGVGKVVGWPFNGQYDGERRVVCEGKLASSVDITHRDMAIACTMGNGVSGGPWLSSEGRKSGSDLGYVVAVASGGAIDEKLHKRLLISAPLSQDVADVLKEHG